MAAACCLGQSAGMAAPVEVGAKGTVGSLVLREVEYFRRMEVAVAGGGHGKKSSSKVVAASGGASPRRSSSSSSKKPKPTKKKGAVAGNGSFLPRMCSSAEVAEDPGSGRRRERPSRVSYRPLGHDGDALPQQD